ncbi:MAG: helix-turn-helix transcriptional regulator [Elusimicrobiota bacterium]
MKEKHIGVRELARKCGVDASFISKIIQGQRNPPSDDKTIKKFATALSVDPVMLTIYTGHIPDSLQPILEDPAFIQNLPYQKQPTRKTPEPTVKPINKKPPQKSDLSDELL